MKAVLIVTALAALAAAGPAKDRRGAKVCNASYPTQSAGGNATQTGGNWSQPSNTGSSSSGTSTSTTMSCPNDGGKTLKYGGSCDCDYSINCASKADTPSTAKFWERTSGEIILSLAECVAICDENQECEACIWYVLKLWTILSKVSARANRYVI